MTLRHRRAASALAAVLTAGSAAVAAGATAPASATPNPSLVAAPRTTPTPTTPPAAPTPQPTSTIGGEGLLKPGILVSRRAGVPAPPELKAASYLVADADDGRVILAKNAHVKALPASTMKTLTALTLAPKLAPATVVKATPEDAAIDGTKVGLLPGQTYTVKQLLLGMLLTSGNDAATALARANGGVPATAREMTEKAHSLGAMDTVAKNPSGLDATGQVTSAYDLALLGRAAINDADVAPYLTVKTANMPGKRTAGPTSTREQFQISSHNRMLWNYDGMIGVKNGYTIKAGQTYVGAARRGDQTYIITFLGGNATGWRETAAVLDWAFANGTKVGPVGDLVDPASFGPNATAPTEPDEPDATHAAMGGMGGIDLSTNSAPGRLALLAGGAAALAAAGAVTWSRLRRR